MIQHRLGDFKAHAEALQPMSQASSAGHAATSGAQPLGLLQQRAGALNLGVAPGPQLGIEPRPDMIVDRLLDDRSR
jgi:hypothetical protein